MGARRSVVAVVVVLGLLSAACGDDDGVSSTASETTTPSTTEPASTTTSVPEVAEVDELDEIALSEPEDVLAGAVSCAVERAHPDAPGVLLVPGTGLSAEENWSLTLAGTLPDEGYDVCTVDLADHAVADIQRSAEHVVAALRTMSDAGYDEIHVVGFSQGVLAARWALAWWPDVAEPVVALTSIAGPNLGTASTAQLCADACAAAIHQMAPGSNFLAALDAVWPDVANVPVTVVASTTDEVVAAGEATLDGATVIYVQDVCPGRQVGHVELVADGAAVGVVLDALRTGGAVVTDDIDPAVCDAPGIGAEGWDAGALTQAAFGVILSAPVVADEPPLAPYAAHLGS